MSKKEMKNYIITAIVRGRKQTITIPSTKPVAIKRANSLREEMRVSIPKFRWAKNIKVSKLK